MNWQLLVGFAIMGLIFSLPIGGAGALCAKQAEQGKIVPLFIGLGCVCADTLWVVSALFLMVHIHGWENHITFVGACLMLGLGTVLVQEKGAQKHKKESWLFVIALRQPLCVQGFVAGISQVTIPFKIIFFASLLGIIPQTDQESYQALFGFILGAGLTWTLAILSIHRIQNHSIVVLHTVGWLLIGLGLIGFIKLITPLLY